MAKRDTSSIGQIKVRHEDAPENEYIVLHFATREAYDEFRRQHMQSVGTKIVDEFWGAACYHDAQPAMNAVRAFCRAPFKANTTRPADLLQA